MQFVWACPKCGGDKLRRSRIRHLGELLYSLFGTPYRCRACDHREFVVRFAVPRAEENGEEAVNQGPAVSAAATAAATPQAAEHQSIVQPVPAMEAPRANRGETAHSAKA